MKDAAWPATRVDYFILNRLERAGLTPGADADNATLLRRVYFDLIGLPPTLEEMAAFEKAAQANRAAALAEVVDRLLASPDYGARWGRHWLDVARYAESSGNTRNMAYIEAWRYRNYVVRAFNRNVPFDRFIREQIAGDLLPVTDPKLADEQLLGTGFLAIGTKTLGEMDPLTYELNVADDQIDTTCRAFLALSANCARCHDHKFDPIPARDYYAMAGIFRSTRSLGAVQTNNRMEEADGIPLGPTGRAMAAALKVHELKRAEIIKEMEPVTKKRDALREELKKSGYDATRPHPRTERLAIATAAKLAILSVFDSRLAAFNSRLKKNNEERPKIPTCAMGVEEREKPIDSPLYEKGDPKRPTTRPVPRGALSAIQVRLAPIPAAESGRLQLADWIASPKNPLTARVIVNRVWLHVYGRGLVETPDDFGKQGARPSHPELLDDLAARFVEGGWNIKALIRELMLSHTYALTSDLSPALMRGDPGNALLGRAHRKPMDAEAMRDAVLALSGALKHEMLEESIVDKLARPMNPQQRELGRNGFLTTLMDTQTYRAVYLPVLRGGPLPLQQCFDVADPAGVAGARRSTIVPSQSLFLMNSDFMMKNASGLAQRVLALPAHSLDDRIALAWRMVFTRAPAPGEIASLRRFLADKPADANSWAMACQAMMMAGEFRTLY